MKNVIILCLFFGAFVSCVQPTYQKTIVCTLSVPSGLNIKTVGIRGEGNPLSWDKDILLTEKISDSLYSVTVTGKTPYKFVEVKFTINGEFELIDKPNRKIWFSDSDTTFYYATFNLE